MGSPVNYNAPQFRYRRISRKDMLRIQPKKFLFHLSVAMGSVAELETHLLLAKRFGYGKNEAVGELLELCDRVGECSAIFRKR